MVLAQKAHPMRHPTCDEMHTVLPWWYCMSTVSMQLPSASSHRYFMVPSSLDTCFRATVGAVIQHVSASWTRRGLDRSVISSKERTPRCSHVKTCRARNAGCPIPLKKEVSSPSVMDLMSVINSLLGVIPCAAYGRYKIRPCRASGATASRRRPRCPRPAG